MRRRILIGLLWSLPVVLLAGGAWAVWGTPPEARSRVLAFADGSAVGPGALGAPMPVSDDGSTLSVDDGAGSLSIDIGGTAPDLATGNDAAGTLRVVGASRDEVTCTTADLGSANDTAVFAARAGRRMATIQVIDIDGAARCAPGAASTNGMYLNAAAGANQAGGSWTIEDWGGAINCRSVIGATTITVNACEWY